jgi:hypothetical protein
MENVRRAQEEIVGQVKLRWPGRCLEKHYKRYLWKIRALKMNFQLCIHVSKRAHSHMLVTCQIAADRSHRVDHGIPFVCRAFHSCYRSTINWQNGHRQGSPPFPWYLLDSPECFRKCVMCMMTSFIFVYHVFVCTLIII